MSYRVSTAEMAPVKGLHCDYVYDGSSSPLGTIAPSDWQWLIGQSPRLRVPEPPQLSRDPRTHAESAANFPLTIFSCKFIPAEVEICHEQGYLSLVHRDANERMYLVELAEHLNDLSAKRSMHLNGLPAGRR